MGNPKSGSVFEAGGGPTLPSPCLEHSPVSLENQTPTANWRADLMALAWAHAIVG